MVYKPKQTLVQSAANGRSEPKVHDAANGTDGSKAREAALDGNPHDSRN
jgi:hypothetical protein